MLGVLLPEEPPEPPPGLATSAVPPAKRAAISSVERAVLPIVPLPSEEMGTTLSRQARAPKAKRPGARAGALFRHPGESRDLSSRLRGSPRGPGFRRGDG